MGSKGNKRHQKRLATPGHLQIRRKDRTAGKFFFKIKGGPHPKDFCLPLGHVLRDLLNITDNSKETKFIMNKKGVVIDGIPRKDLNFPIGLMDVIELPEINKAYRILASKNHGLMVSEITKDESKFKLCRINNITTVKGGIQQLNLHDGRNILIKKGEKKYKTRGTLKISIPSQEIMEYFEFKENVQGMIYRGTHTGVSGLISKLTKRFGVNASLAQITTSSGEINTSYDYVFVIGSKDTVIDLPMEK
ncbi:30S ribosomal protein S4e [Promethearchaeum syntrophicum]|uniref:Small ribosomal subunit protein eS4 n=1 Tax=Promethearchaeum syntrophicum TaxID=2594042 RepID=A0A5B9D894_9ARCH|nr:30S ribosomal protein S4e [Candidatus Prometheoarchaeum syntrophicum]QEE15354.1 30S ribosomal protein S4e [Candidatus Prometheoarchaeum syntrophicum]